MDLSETSFISYIIHLLNILKFLLNFIEI